MEQRDSVVLVDEYGRDLFSQDGELSTAEKVEAHRRGLLYRAIPVFIFNDRNELLLQKRTVDKYHSPRKWIIPVVLILHQEKLLLRPRSAGSARRWDL